MLLQLSIKNFAIIDDLTINFNKGLTILSGETGAGKSIIINALNLLLGSRASSKLIRTDAEYAEVSAIFEICSKNKVIKEMENAGFNTSDGLIITRIISTNKKHKIFICDRPATTQTLNNLADNLASISGQHAHQKLLNTYYHLDIIDQLSDLLPIKENIYTIYHKTVPLIKKLKKLKSIDDEKNARLEFLEFKKNEIIQANIQPNEDTILEKKLLKFKNSKTLFNVTFQSFKTLYDSSGSIWEKTEEITKDMNKACQLDNNLSDITDSIKNISYSIYDSAETLRSYFQSLDNHETQIDEIEERLSLLNRLKRKYGGSIKSITDHLKSTENEILNITSLSDELSNTQLKIDTNRKELTDLAEKLSVKRKTAGKKIAKKVETELESLSMPGAKFKVDITPFYNKDDTYFTLDSKKITLSETGIDKICFMISANTGEAMKPIAKTASGGELSRIVLALKIILSETESFETIIFDEVDAGIGGMVAETIGKKLKDLSSCHQIICITHLPQIAKYANDHFNIFKKISHGRTKTQINLLDKESRIKEIARMLAGSNITDTSLQHAKEMLENR